MSEHIAEAGHHAGAAVEHTAHGVKGALGHKLGPLPVGGWLLAVAGGVGVAVYFRNRSAANAADLPDITTTDATGPDGFTPNDPGGTVQGVGGAGGPISGTYPYSNTATAGNGNAAVHTGPAALARAAKTNAEWANHAADAMARRGFVHGAVAGTLDKYLAGKRLSAGDELRLQATLATCGPPPNPPKHVALPGTGKPEPTTGHGTKDHGTDNPGGAHTTPGTKPAPPHLPEPTKPTHHQDNPKPPKPHKPAHHAETLKPAPAATAPKVQVPARHRHLGVLR